VFQLVRAGLSTAKGRARTVNRALYARANAMRAHARIRANRAINLQEVVSTDGGTD